MADIQADNADGDSTRGESDPESTDSISSTSRIRNFVEENGRTYSHQAYEQYFLPNDEVEKDRLDLQHELFKKTLGKIFNSPIEKGLHRVLDVGTGTGLWAIEFGEEHPEASVLGIDISLIQPCFVPPNVTFQIDDLEDEWRFNYRFDFIHCRDNIPTISDWPRFFTQSFNHLEPGGYIEVTDIDFLVESDDGTTCRTWLEGWYYALLDASTRAGKPIDSAKLHKDRLVQAGFEDVVENIYKWPHNTWPKTKEEKLRGAFTFRNLGENVSGLSMALLTRKGGWSTEQVEVLLAEVGKNFRDRKIHGYFKVYSVYGRKPKDLQV